MLGRDASRPNKKGLRNAKTFFQFILYFLMSCFFLREASNQFIVIAD